MRLSLDSERSSTPPVQNGVNGHADDEGPSDPLEKLRLELERTKEEKETLAAQYRNLLAKLTTMRTTLGNKLKQDAEELDRREALVQQLTAQNEDLTATVEMLKDEVYSATAEGERATAELDNMRSRVFEESAQENLIRERELRETQTELERCRMEKDEWERMASQDKMAADEARSNAEMYRRDLELEREARKRDAAELESEREKSQNLQSVLQDFQAAKDHELRQAVKDYDSQLIQVTQSLAEFKHRALTAELQLEESQTNTSRTQELEKEVKDKSLLIEKLRHEAIIINEHLMEALRRLRRNSNDTNVDRRLVTNVLLSFLTTPRADAKRFEMLSLLASVLSWSDPEREKAGLQRAPESLAAPSGSSFWGRKSTSTPPAKSPELDKTDETESFSRLWVEFLLTEATSGQSDRPQSHSTPNTPVRANNSLPGTPTSPSMLKGPGISGTRRLSSYGHASSQPPVAPSLLIGDPPIGRKGKGKEKSEGS
ncbi:hypothetical protein FB45DRAFT_743754 [Roridomyces roridus]|uniref:GRIP domain-containing protein n=1 Tax=Roridomyces roridus TaxID=1738132 RepID=A0AAD7FR71_9AGAR|nr:hypothetical protein FB45DRAFT_743754 [Roridomyces roridus]